MWDRTSIFNNSYVTNSEIIIYLIELCMCKADEGSPCIMKTAINNMQTVHIVIFLYNLIKQTTSQIWPAAHSLPTPDIHKEVRKFELCLRNVDSMSTRGRLAVLSDVASCSLMNCLFSTHFGVLACTDLSTCGLGSWPLLPRALSTHRGELSVLSAPEHKAPNFTFTHKFSK